MAVLSPPRFGSPAVPPGAVERAHLLQRMDEATARRLTVLVAPPGSGKSVLLAQWAESHPEQLTAWLAMEPGDDDGVRFAAHLVEALQLIEPSVGAAALERVDTTGLVAGEGFLDAIVSDLAGLPPAVLVIEDLHNLNNSALLDELAQFFERAPDQIRFVVSSRSDPLPSLQRLRMRDELSELRHDALVLQAGEAQELVLRVGAVELGTEQLARVVDRTEGWVAGVQLAALSMRDTADLDMFVDLFAGDDRAITDYLTEEILAHQPPEVRRFLLRTSVLDRLTAPLCDTVTGDLDGQRMLDELDRRGLFLTPLDRRRGWYRYHGLFRDVLRFNLLAEDRDLERTLLHRAANWHLTEGHLTVAMEYLIEARAWDQVTELVLQNGGDMWERGEATTALRWLETVPEHAQSTRPAVRLARATLNVMVGRAQTADRIIGELEASPTITPGELIYVDLLRAILAQHGLLTPERIVASADRALAGLETAARDQVPDVMGFGLPARAEVALLGSKGRALQYQGDVVGARDLLVRATESAGMSFSPYAVHVFGARAVLEASEGQLSKAQELAEHALALAGEAGLVSHLSTADALLALGLVALERGDLEEASGLLDEAAARSAQNRRYSLMAAIRAARARVTLAGGQAGAALRELAAPSGAPPVPQGVATALVATEVGCLVACDDCDQARVVLDAFDGDPTVELRSAALALAVAREDVAAARAALAEWPEPDDVQARVRRSVWEAVVCEMEGDRASARERMAEAVALAEPEGHVRVFVDAGPVALRLLRALERSRTSPYLRRLTDPDLASPQARRLETPLVEQLSGRETAVLRYLPSRMSNADIAARLYISQNTLKTHLKHIYRKLEVAGRDEAVAAAERYGLL